MAGLGWYSLLRVIVGEGHSTSIILVVLNSIYRAGWGLPLLTRSFLSERHPFPSAISVFVERGKSERRVLQFAVGWHSLQNLDQLLGLTRNPVRWIVNLRSFAGIGSFAIWSDRALWLVLLYNISLGFALTRTGLALVVPLRVAQIELILVISLIWCGSIRANLTWVITRKYPEKHTEAHFLNKKHSSRFYFMLFFFKFFYV